MDTIIFSDECKFDLTVGDQGSRVILNKKEVFYPDCLKWSIIFPARLMVHIIRSNIKVKIDFNSNKVYFKNVRIVIHYFVI